MKRLYKSVSVQKEEGGGFSIRLDGRPVKTADGKFLSVQDERLANSLMLEWSAQGNKVDPKTMPVTQIVMTAFEQTKSREEIIAHILDYIDTDLVAYQADSEPYKSRQADIWGRWIEWLGKRYDIVFKTTDQIEGLVQPDMFKSMVRSYLEKLNDIDLTLFQSLIEDTSSPVLTLALFEKAANADDIYEAVMLDDMIRAEIYDEEKYGAAPDQVKKRKVILASLKAAETIISFRN